MPDWTLEEKCSGFVCGIDEAGRGPWVGPVVAGAVVFKTKEINPELTADLNDSKKLSAKKREKLYALLREEEKNGNVYIGVGKASAEEIDTLNILQATFLAMKRAVSALPIVPDFALIDGNRLPTEFICPATCHIGGDAKSYSIAAASIIAKVFRDNLMKELAQKYPWYGFEKNAGYGTKDHVAGLQKYGIIKGEHRLSYKPVKAFMQKI